MFDKRVIFTLIISLLICMVIGFVNKNIPTDELIKQLFVNKIHSDKTYDLLIVGDSRVYRGVSTQPFEKILKVDAFNLGFSSALYEKQLFDLIEQKWNKKASKPTIVLGITPHSFTRYSLPNGHIHELRNMKKEDVLKYSYFLPLTSVFTPYSIHEILAYLSNEDFVKDGYMQAPDTKEGWVASDFSVRLPYKALKSYHTTFKNRKVDSIVMSQFFNQVVLWSNKGYKVYGFIPPSSPNMESLERNYSGFSDRDVVKEFIESGGKWIELDSVYNSYDGSHLIKEDAIRLSNELALKIHSDRVDSIFDFNKDYLNSYLPLKKLKMGFYDGFENGSISYKTDLGRDVGKIDPSVDFYNFTKINTDTLLKKGVKKIIASAVFLCQKKEMNFNMVFEMKRGEEYLVYKKLPSKWILKEGLWGKITIEFDLPDDLQSGDVIKCYVYNNEKKEFFIDDMELLFY